MDTSYYDLALVSTFMTGIVYEIAYISCDIMISFSQTLIGALKMSKMSQTDLIYPMAEYSEKDGPVLWHHLNEYGQLCEAPIVASLNELDDLQPWDNYYSHWSPLPTLPEYPCWAARIAPDHHRLLICDGWAYTDG